VFVLGLYSCGNNCDGVECGVGTCEDGTCICPDGTEGTACEIIANAIYYGDYEVVVPTCGTTSNTATVKSMSIVAHSNGNPTEIELTASTSSITGTINGTIVNGNIEAEGPFSTFTMEISGTFSDNDNMEVTFRAAGFVCSDVTYAK